MTVQDILDVAGTADGNTSWGVDMRGAMTSLHDHVVNHPGGGLVPWVNAADFGSDGAAIQAAYDSDGGSSKVVVVPRGTWPLSTSLVFGKERTLVWFELGAAVTWSAVTGTTPLIQISYSNVHLWQPRVVGSGSKGNGTGIRVGVDGAGLAQPHGCQIYNPSLDNLDAGVEFGINETDTQSSGDNTVWGGRITDCKDGIRSKGFVNFVDGSFISNVNIGIHQTTARNSGRIVARNVTINQWADAMIAVDRGRGSSFDDCWGEHTVEQTPIPTEVIRIGSASYQAVNTRIGTVHLHPIKPASGTPELYVLRLVDVNGLHVDHLEMTDELPSVAAVRVDATHTGHSNVIERISIGDTVPAGWDPNTMVLSDGGAAGSVQIRAIPGLPGDPAGTTIGDYR